MSVAAPNPEFPGPLGYIGSSGTAYMPWTKGEEVNFAISRDGGTTWTNCVVAKGDTVKGGTAGFAVADNQTYDEAAATRHWEALERLYGDRLSNA